MEDQRDVRRYPVQFGVELIGDLIDGKGVVLDLSTGGGAVRTAVPMADASYVRLLLHPPHAEAPIKVELAAVRWTKGETFGLEFICMNADQQKRLRDFLAILQMAPSC